jgi:hypothetical protein
MAFLDNSGDIILDAVLTDTGRMRLAKGDGTFRIAKFALGDDEINYGSYNKSHPSGSAYFDLEILQTPVLEALTNNTSTMNSKIVSIPRTNLLYLPVIKLATDVVGFQQNTTEQAHVVAVDDNTVVELTGVTGVLNGVDARGVVAGIRADQGLDTGEIPYTFTIDSDLYETQYIVEIDNRLGQIMTNTGNSTKVSFIDDDNIASYYFSAGTDSAMIDAIDATGTSQGGTDVSSIAGPRGSKLMFRIKASVELNSSTFLFTQLGSTATTIAAVGGSFYFIDTVIRITGATTGYRLDVPVRFVKLNN